jgi:membrane protein YdbS with pleckstrin-like domain
MGVVDRYLEPGEQVVFRTRFHPAVFAGTIGFALFVLGVAALIMVRNDLAASTIAFLWLGALLVGGSGFVMPVLRWRAAEFAVTSARVLVTAGPRVVVLLALPLAQVRTIEVVCPLAGRLLGYGTVRLAGKDGSVEVFHRVARAQELRDAVARGAPRSVRVGRS